MAAKNSADVEDAPVVAQRDGEETYENSEQLVPECDEINDDWMTVSMVIHTRCICPAW